MKQKYTKRAVSILLVAVLVFSVCGCTTSNKKEAEYQLQEEIGAFEITANQREAAKQNTAGYSVLDAGRGNPNWINAKVRDAFTRLMDFATEECRRTIDNGDMAGHCVKEEIAGRFDAYLNKNNEADAFLAQAVDYCVNNLGLDREEVLYEMCNGITGDYYPSPSRCLKNTEVILNDYLQSTLYNGVDLKSQTDIFPTEGGSAAMTYIFQSLYHNKVLKPGDTIAIATPIFTPYLQIPDVNNYDLISVNVESTDESNWDIPKEELDKLADKKVKAFFLVNPSNPASHALSQETLDYLAKVVEKNPDLIILTDDVYGTFVDNFQTVYSKIPYNTILVYSFSKLYGVTGWRTGLVAMNKDNVVDKIIANLSKSDKDELRDEYDIVEENPDNMKFMERLTADSRSIGLYHTSGLSTPSQIFMDLMALSHLATNGKDEYIELANKTVNERYVAFMDAIGLPKDETIGNAKYYTVININKIVETKYGADAVKKLSGNKTEIQILDDLAQNKGVVLMYGPGFKTKDGMARVSLANLNAEDYVEIARRISEMLEEYHQQGVL